MSYHVLVVRLTTHIDEKLFKDMSQSRFGSDWLVGCVEQYDVMVTCQISVVKICISLDNLNER